MKLLQLISAHQRTDYKCSNTQQTKSETPAWCFSLDSVWLSVWKHNKLTTSCDFNILPSKKIHPPTFFFLWLLRLLITEPLVHPRAYITRWGYHLRLPLPFSRMSNTRQKVKTNLTVCLHLVSSKDSIGFSLRSRLKLKEEEKKTKPKPNCKLGKVRCSLIGSLRGSRYGGGDNGHHPGGTISPAVAVLMLLSVVLGPSSQPLTLWPGLALAIDGITSRWFLEVPPSTHYLSYKYLLNFYYVLETGDLVVNRTNMIVVFMKFTI